MVSVILKPRISLSAAFPNEPASAITINRWAFDWSNGFAQPGAQLETLAQPWDGFYFQGNWGGVPTDESQVDPTRGTTETDQNGPVNPNKVGRYNYNSSTMASPFGDALLKPSSLEIWLPPPGYSEGYLSQWLKLSTPPNDFYLPAAQLKTGNVWYNSGGFLAPLIPEINAEGIARPGHSGVGNTDEPYSIEMRVADTDPGHFIDSKIGQRGATGGGSMIFTDATPYIVNGTWFQLEFHWVVSTREIKMWVGNNVGMAQTLVAHGIAGGWPNDDIFEFSWDGTLGGQCTGCPELTHEIYWYQDDLYFSYVP